MSQKIRSPILKKNILSIFAGYYNFSSELIISWSEQHLLISPSLAKSIWIAVPGADLVAALLNQGLIAFQLWVQIEWKVELTLYFYVRKSVFQCTRQWRWRMTQENCVSPSRCNTKGWHCSTTVLQFCHLLTGSTAGMVTMTDKMNWLKSNSTVSPRMNVATTVQCKCFMHL